MAGTLERLEPEYRRYALQLGDTFLGIGANLGFFTIVAAMRVGASGDVYAFEPSRRKRRYLPRNIELNGLTNVTIVPYAVSDHTGREALAIAADGGLKSLRKNVHSAQQIINWSTVEVKTLDAFMEGNHIEPPAMIKIDVKGGEQNVLAGSPWLLTCSTPPIILCEFCDLTATGYHISGRELYDGFLALGYRLFSLCDSVPPRLQMVERKEKYDFENLVACRTP